MSDSRVFHSRNTAQKERGIKTELFYSIIKVSLLKASTPRFKNPQTQLSHCRDPDSNRGYCGFVTFVPQRKVLTTRLSRQIIFLLNANIRMEPECIWDDKSPEWLVDFMFGTNIQHVQLPWIYFSQLPKCLFKPSQRSKINSHITGIFFLVVKSHLFINHS